MFVCIHLLFTAQTFSRDVIFLSFIILSRNIRFPLGLKWNDVFAQFKIMVFILGSFLQNAHCICSVILLSLSTISTYDFPFPTLNRSATYFSSSTCAPSISMWVYVCAFVCMQNFSFVCKLKLTVRRIIEAEERKIIIITTTKDER